MTPGQVARQARDGVLLSQQMTTADKVRAATSPQEAMLAVAEAMDELLARADVLLARETVPQPTSTWGSWINTSANNQHPPAVLAMPVVDRSAEIKRLRDDLLIASGEDATALEAKLRLLLDDGQALLDTNPFSGARIGIDGELVDFPPVSATRKGRRGNWAASRGLERFLAQGNELIAEEMVDAYIAGGPMWLYLYDRDAVMQLPAEWRKDMVGDVECDSPAQAQELARDILKDSSPDGAQEPTLDALAKGQDG